jgi:hypothetical protein
MAKQWRLRSLELSKQGPHQTKLFKAHASEEEEEEELLQAMQDDQHPSWLAPASESTGGVCSGAIGVAAGPFRDESTHTNAKKKNTHTLSLSLTPAFVSEDGWLGSGRGGKGLVALVLTWRRRRRRHRQLVFQCHVSGMCLRTCAAPSVD